MSTLGHYERYSIAIEAAKRAGDYAGRFFEATQTGEELIIQIKDDDSPVTIADQNAEKIIRAYIEKSFPDDGILGEEFPEKPSKTGYRWIIDPIDGTKSFIRHIPIWATLVGVEYADQQVIGICYIPMLQQMIRALHGDGAFLNDKRMHVSTVNSMKNCLLCYSSLMWFKNAGKLELFMELYEQSFRQRGYGDFYGFIMVAQGSADVMLEHGIKPWDIAATKVIIEEAGGKVTDWQGHDTIHTPDVVATNGHLHEYCLSVLRQAK